ncbi:hypothetical protein [Streptomyces sp. NPDC091268]|uniref:hypothetical protein n=1 Tax=Streptomyces sp. NPDC091268 TaxID=3365979 RepID=UPI0037FC7460
MGRETSRGSGSAAGADGAQVETQAGTQVGTQGGADSGTDGLKGLELSVAQVAGSSLATVAAALLASRLGVYGTILGAGVVSVVATAGGPVIQHLFKRTGDQLRGSARPRARRVPEAHPAPERGSAPAREEFGAATVHGTRVRGWKRTAVASGAAFAIALGGLGAYEAVAGTSISADGSTIRSAGTRKAPDQKPPRPEEQPGHREKGEQDGRGGKGTPAPDSGASASPSDPHGGRGPSPDPSPSDPGGPTPTPTPTPPGPGPTPKPTPTAEPSSGGSADHAPAPGAGRQQGGRTPS